MQRHFQIIIFYTALPSLHFGTGISFTIILFSETQVCRQRRNNITTKDMMKLLTTAD